MIPSGICIQKRNDILYEKEEKRSKWILQRAFGTLNGSCRRPIKRD